MEVEADSGSTTANAVRAVGATVNNGRKRY